MLELAEENACEDYQESSGGEGNSNLHYDSIHGMVRHQWKSVTIGRVLGETNDALQKATHLD